jgi:hypothetical protein
MRGNQFKLARRELMSSDVVDGLSNSEYPKIANLGVHCQRPSEQYSSKSA